MISFRSRSSAAVVNKPVEALKEQHTNVSKKRELPSPAKAAKQDKDKRSRVLSPAKPGPKSRTRAVPKLASEQPENPFRARKVIPMIHHDTHYNSAIFLELAAFCIRPMRILDSVT